MMKKLILFFVTLLAGWLFQTNVNAQSKIERPRSYWLATSGNDEGPATRQKPWRTIQKLNSQQLHAGDTIFFKGGDTFEGSLRLAINGSKAVAFNTLLSSFGNGSAIIDGKNESAINANDIDNLVIKNLKLVGAGRKTGNKGNGLSLSDCSRVTVENVEASGFQHAGVLVNTSSFVRLLHINAHDNGFAGISITGRYQEKNSCHDLYVAYCHADNNPGSPVILNNHSGNGIVAGYCSKLTIEYCVATNNGWDMPRIGNGPVGIWCYETDSALIQHCLSYRNKTSAGGDDGGGFDFDGGVTNSTLQYCLSYENQGSGYGIFQYAGAGPWYHNTIRYNISYNDGLVSAAHAGFYIWNSSDNANEFYDCVFYNNTIVNNKGTAVNFARQSDRKQFSFFNNIFVGGDSVLAGKRREDDVFMANNWWCLKNGFYQEGFTSLDKWANNSGVEMKNGKLTGLSVDPGFTETGKLSLSSWEQLKAFTRYRLPKESVLRTKGIDLQKAFGIGTSRLDSNGHPAPATGVGACF